MAASLSSEPHRDASPNGRPAPPRSAPVGALAGPLGGGPSVPYGDADPEDRVYVPAVSCAGCGEVNCLRPRGQIFLCRWCIEGTPSPARMEAFEARFGAEQPAGAREQTTRLASKTRAA